MSVEETIAVFSVSIVVFLQQTTKQKCCFKQSQNLLRTSQGDYLHHFLQYNLRTDNSLFLTWSILTNITCLCVRSDCVHHLNVIIAPFKVILKVLFVETLSVRGLIRHFKILHIVTNWCDTSCSLHRGWRLLHPTEGPRRYERFQTAAVERDDFCVSSPSHLTPVCSRQSTKASSKEELHSHL